MSNLNNRIASINASPLIFLSRSRHLQLLKIFAEEIWVPDVVATEIQQMGADDLAGRKCAASLNIPVRGTLGIVLNAKYRGHIPKARPVIEDMMRAGLYLSKPVLEQALRRVDE